MSAGSGAGTRQEYEVGYDRVLWQGSLLGPTIELIKAHVEVPLSLFLKEGARLICRKLATIGFGDDRGACHVSECMTPV
jgi:hypothetical protein